MSVGEYYGKLNKDWDEFNNLDGFPECGVMEKCSWKMRDSFCDHCKMKGHTKEGCFKRNGYPEW